MAAFLYQEFDHRKIVLDCVDQWCTGIAVQQIYSSTVLNDHGHDIYQAKSREEMQGSIHLAARDSSLIVEHRMKSMCELGFALEELEHEVAGLWNTAHRILACLCVMSPVLDGIFKKRLFRIQISL